MAVSPGKVLTEDNLKLQEPVLKVQVKKKLLDGVDYIYPTLTSDQTSVLASYSKQFDQVFEIFVSKTSKEPKCSR